MPECTQGASGVETISEDADLHEVICALRAAEGRDLVVTRRQGRGLLAVGVLTARGVLSRVMAGSVGELTGLRVRDLLAPWTAAPVHCRARPRGAWGLGRLSS